MKKALIILMVLCSSLSVYSKACQNDANYTKNGWVVSYPEDFDSYVHYFNIDLNDGLLNGYFIPDLEGTLVTSHSTIQGRVYMNVRSWDDTETSKNEMFGDIAMFRNSQNLSQVLELRWYSEGVRYIFVNKKYMDCVSIAAPLADNVVL
jgi:hypothetical protein